MAKTTATRRRMGLPVLRRLHVRAAEVYGERAHAELHCLAAVWFGADHLNELSEGQSWLLLKALDGGIHVDPSPKREALLKQLDEVLASAGGDVREHVLSAARKQFKAEPGRELDYCGIGRVGALLKVAQYYIRRS